MIKHVPPGYYENIPDLIEVIKNIYGSTQDKKSTTKVKLIGLEMTYNSSTRRVLISADKMKLRIKRDDGKMYSPRVHDAAILLRDKRNEVIDEITNHAWSEMEDILAAFHFHHHSIRAMIVFHQPS